MLPGSRKTFKTERVLEKILYRPANDPNYQVAWRDARLVEANLVLEGGGMRGIFTSGVLDYFMDEKFLPKHVIGVSAGALNGLNYVAGARGRSCYINSKYCANWRYLSIRSFLVSGNVLNAFFVFDKIINELEPFDYESYQASPLDLVAVCSNLETGEADYTLIDNLPAQLAYLRASSAMPFASRTVCIDGKLLLDGGSCDSVPIVYSQNTGAKKHVVILTQDASYIKEPNKFLSLSSIRYRRYPRFVERIKHRYIEYNNTYRLLEHLHKTGEIFLLRPPAPVKITNIEHDAEKIFELYLSGYEEARRNFDALQRYLEL